MNIILFQFLVVIKTQMFCLTDFLSDLIYVKKLYNFWTWDLCNNVILHRTMKVFRFSISINFSFSSNELWTTTTFTVLFAVVVNFKVVEPRGLQYEKARPGRVLPSHRGPKMTDFVLLCS